MASKNRGMPPLSAEALQAWDEVLQVADAVRAAEPWLHTSNIATLGVRDPVTGEINWCRILGQDQQFFGIAIYPGDACYATLQRAEARQVEEFDIQITQKVAILEFTRSADVTPQCKAILKQLRRTYRGANSWPDLVWREPGYVPVPPWEPIMLRRIANALRGLLALMPWLQQQSHRGRCDDAGQAFVIEPPFDASRLVQVPIPQLQPAPVEVPVHDRLAARRLQQSAGAAHGPWYLDWFSGFGVVDGPEAAGRPYFLGHMVVLDLQSDQILGMDVARIEEVPAKLQQNLLGTIPKSGCPPELVIRRASLMPILQPLANDLGIELVLDPASVQFTHGVVQSMLGFFGR